MAELVHSAGLKHQWIHFHAGSIPALGTKNP